MPKLTPEESKAIGGAAAEAEKQEKARAAQAAIDKLGISQEKVTFKKGELPEGTRVVGQAEASASPKPQLSDKPKRASKRAPRPKVKRGAGGRIEPIRTPIAPVAERKPLVRRGPSGRAEAIPEGEPVTTPAPAKRDSRTIARPVKKRRKTRSGKKIDPKTGRIANTGTVRLGKSGKIEAIPVEERQSLVTQLPAQEALEQKPRSIQRPAIVRGGVRPEVKGGAVSYPRIHAAVSAAMGHLSNMRLSERGSDEFKNHEKLFDAIHENIKPMSPELHLSLGQAKHHITVGGPKMEENLGLVHKAINARLGIIKQAHEDNIRRAQAGREKKAGNQ